MIEIDSSFDAWRLTMGLSLVVNHIKYYLILYNIILNQIKRLIDQKERGMGVNGQTGWV